jgi:phage tail-like protein
MSLFGIRLRRSLSVAVVAISILGVVPAQAQNGTRTDPQHAFTFKVEIEGVDAHPGFFRSVSGLSAETEVVEYREGGSDLIRKLPGAQKYPNLVLKRGYTGDQTLYNWYQSVKKQNFVKVKVTITILDAHLTSVAKYNFYEAWPSKWEISDMDSSKSGVSTETIEIAHEGFEQE